MALVCEELKLLKDSSQKNEMAGGKNFLSDVDFPDDAVSAPALKSGILLSGGKEDKRDSVNDTNV
ncbi:hypothetical protein [Rickettsia australis]|uniref:Uncharacterized protein n=1 Tax=Rickettsia australis (strain Cutlack) TaxID=1105110 RepID=H8K6R7_RICAC|nr:hypothetical protein [Rickettsia australis]AFC70960.1 hypothetical protein MC5_03045 [Rickettsia australis str. Cutlack]